MSKQVQTLAADVETLLHPNDVKQINQQEIFPF